MLARLGARPREVEPERGLGDPRGQGGNGERGESEGKQSAHDGILAVVRTSR